MRFFNRYRNRGFTLVELMIVVAIIGVLAALAIYGVRRYLASAKTSEAKNTIGAISRGAVGAYEAESTAQQLLSAGGESGAEFTHDLCDSASPVPANMTAVQGKKYQPNIVDAGSDFDAGNATSAWKCLKFTINSPIYYQYDYQAETQRGGTANVTARDIAAPPDPGFVATAQGDLTGDGTIFSAFAQRGGVDTTVKALRLATQIEIVDEYE